MTRGTHPKRPMLAPEVFARRHVAGGRATVILHDSRRFRAIEIGTRGHAVVSLLDGTRDVEGVLAALSHRASRDEVEAFLGELHAAGVLTERPREAEAARASSPETAHEAKPVVAMPGFRLRCDGRGSCCRLYPSIVFSPRETARARALLPDVLDGGDDEALAFLPERGNDRRSLAVALVDGRCAYLGGDGRCGVHAAGGARAKPFGCSLYPLSLVDDGESVRATPVVECACVVESAVHPTGEGEPLLDGAVATSLNLDPRLVVDELPAEIALGPTARAARGAVTAWADRAAAADPVNPVAYLDALSGAVEDGELGADLDAFAARAAFGPRGLEQRIEVLRERAARRASEGFRAPADLAHQTFSLIELGAGVALADLEGIAAAAPRTRPAEAFYVRAELFGRRVIPSPPDTLAGALRDRAARLLVARGVAVAATIGELGDPAFRHPIALVEAACRAYGLASS